MRPLIPAHILQQPTTLPSPTDQTGLFFSLPLMLALIAFELDLPLFFKEWTVAILMHSGCAARAGESLLAIAFQQLQVADCAGGLLGTCGLAPVAGGCWWLVHYYYVYSPLPAQSYFKTRFICAHMPDVCSRHIAKPSMLCPRPYPIQMFNSKINQLRESTFRQRPSLPKSSGYKGRVNSVLIAAEEPSVDISSALKDYLLNLPLCPFHHEPIRFLCLSPTCTSSTFALCSHPHCRTLHSDPSSELIELDSFNEFMAGNCSSLLLLAKRAEGYLQDFRQKLMQQMDRLIAKTKYIFENVYMGQVPRLVRQGKHRELTSQRLFKFVKHESFQNNLQQRIQMEGLRNEVATRMGQFQANFQHLVNGKDFQGLVLGDIVKSTQGESPFAMLGRIDIHQFQSRILQTKEDFQEICKMLKENRAPAFSSITTIFRASERHFSAEAFHKSVDGKAPLLILVKSTLGRRFGVFLNFRIDQREEWIPDATGLSFIFSLDRNESYKLKPQANSRLKAAFGGPQGPQVGSGCDLYIVDQCHLRRGSGANLGGSYRLPGYLQFGTAKARAYLANQESFLVEEYEAFLMQ